MDATQKVVGGALFGANRHVYTPHQHGAPKLLSIGNWSWRETAVRWRYDNVFVCAWPLMGMSAWGWEWWKVGVEEVSQGSSTPRD